MERIRALSIIFPVREFTDVFLPIARRSCALSIWLAVPEFTNVFSSVMECKRTFSIISPVREFADVFISIGICLRASSIIFPVPELSDVCFPVLAIDGNMNLGKCVQCRKWFRLDAGRGRSDKQYCSNACRMRAYRKRKVSG